MKDSQVAVILEEVRSQFKAIKEDTADIPKMKEDIAEIKVRLTKVENDIEVIKISLKNKTDLEETKTIAKELKILKQKIA